MGFIQKKVDMKKLARVLRKRPGDPEWKSKFAGAVTPGELTPAMYRVYIQVLRHGEIFITELNFDEISYDDIDDLESVLADNPSHNLFRLGEVFRAFAPSAPDKRVFI